MDEEEYETITVGEYFDKHSPTVGNCLFQDEGACSGWQCGGPDSYCASGIDPDQLLAEALGIAFTYAEDDTRDRNLAALEDEVSKIKKQIKACRSRSSRYFYSINTVSEQEKLKRAKAKFTEAEGDLSMLSVAECLSGFGALKPLPHSARPRLEAKREEAKAGLIAATNTLKAKKQELRNAAKSWADKAPIFLRLSKELQAVEERYKEIVK